MRYGHLPQIAPGFETFAIFQASESADAHVFNMALRASIPGTTFKVKLMSDGSVAAAVCSKAGREERHMVDIFTQAFGAGLSSCRRGMKKNGTRNLFEGIRVMRGDVTAGGLMPFVSIPAAPRGWGQSNNEYIASCIVNVLRKVCSPVRIDPGNYKDGDIEIYIDVRKAPSMAERADIRREAHDILLTFMTGFSCGQVVKEMSGR